MTCSPGWVRGREGEGIGGGGLKRLTPARKGLESFHLLFMGLPDRWTLYFHSCFNVFELALPALCVNTKKKGRGRRERGRKKGGHGTHFHIQINATKK